jgi:hypothetical protein
MPAPLLCALLHASDLDALDNGPSSRWYSFVALTAIFEHELDCLTDHHTRFIESLALRVHLGQLLHVGVYPSHPSPASSNTTLNLRAFISRNGSVRR